MKLQLLIPAIFLWFGQVLWAQPLPTRIEKQQRSVSDEPLNVTEEQLLFYNPNGTIDYTQTNTYNGVNWQRQRRNYQIFDNLGRYSELLSRSWNGLNWIDKTRLTYTYADDDDESATWFHFDEYVATMGVWRPLTRSYSVFSENNYRLSTVNENWLYLSQRWDTTGISAYTYDEAWNTTSIRTAYQSGIYWIEQYSEIAYDSLNRRILSLNEEYRDSVLVQKDSIVFTFIGADPNYDEKHTFRYVDALQQWTNYDREYHTHSPTEWITVRQYFDPATQEWINIERSTSQNQPDGKSLSFLFEFWDSDANEWYPQYGNTRTYNPDNSIAVDSVRRLDFETGEFFVLSVDTYEYNQITGTSAPTLDVETRIFPNPTHDVLHVSIASQQATLAALYNVKGELLSTQAFAGGSTVFSMVNQPTGVYYLKITHQGAEKVVPIVKR